MRFGVIGTNFVSDWFVEACAQADVEVAAVYSRTAERAASFADQHGIAGRFSRLDAMLDAVDAVYVASPIAAHREHSLAAIAAGKHVLCEKTIGVDVAEASEVFEAARAAGVVALEAVRPLFDPAFELVRSSLSELGEVRYVRFEKCQYSSRYDAFLRGELPNAFNPELGNSAVSDIGVYCIAPMIDLFGVPAAVAGSNVTLSNGFDAAGALVFGYSSMVGHCVYSKVSESVAPSIVQGEKATLVIDSIANPGEIRLVPRSGAERVLFSAPASASGNMRDEVEAFVRLVEADDVDHRYVGIALASRAIMDDLLRPTSPS